MIPTYRLGLTNVFPEYNIFLTDIDGADIMTEFMDEVTAIRNDRSKWYRPYSFYVATGMIGFVSAEVIVVYVAAGMPFIFTSTISVEGTDEYDGHIETAGEKLIGRLFDKDNSMIYSLGYVDSHTNVLRTAKSMLEKETLFADETIDPKLGNTLIQNNNLRENGVLMSPGKYRYSVYALPPEISSAMRPDKDFMMSPTGDFGGKPGMKEIVLCGGNPEIMPIGMFCNLGGNTFNVWIPNDINYYQRAVEYFNSDRLPRDVIDFELDNLLDAYALFCVYANKLDETNNLNDEEDDDEDVNLEDVVPDGMVN